jgi:hypothetical protein
MADIKTMETVIKMINIHQLSEEIVLGVLKDLLDRRGFRQAWDDTDEDIQKEIIGSLGGGIEAAIHDWVEHNG